MFQQLMPFFSLGRLAGCQCYPTASRYSSVTLLTAGATNNTTTTTTNTTKSTTILMMRRLKHGKKIAYSRRKLDKRMAGVFSNPKSLSGPRHKKKLDGVAIGFADNRPVDQQSIQMHPDVARRLEAVAMEFKSDLYDIIHSGRYDGDVTALNISKFMLSPDGKEILITWAPTGDGVKDRALELMLFTSTSDIQRRFDELHPTITSPKIKFKKEYSMSIDVSQLMDNLDLGYMPEDEVSDTSEGYAASRRLRSLTFVQDVYDLNRHELVSKILSTSENRASFGANERLARFSPSQGEDSTET